VVVGSLNVDLVAPVERLPRSGETVTGSDLERTPGGWGVAGLTRDSMYKVELHSSDAVSAVKYALNALQAEIQHQRRQAEDGYRKSIR